MDPDDSEDDDDVARALADRRAVAVVGCFGPAVVAGALFHLFVTLVALEQLDPPRVAGVLAAALTSLGPFAGLRLGFAAIDRNETGAWVGLALIVAALVELVSATGVVWVAIHR